MSDVNVSPKKFLAIPRDAFDLLDRRYSTLAEATEAASEVCSDTGVAVIVVEMKAIAARADRPVKVKKL